VAQGGDWGDALVKVVVYVEGGGHQRKILDDCRRGFGQLFEKVVRQGQPPKVRACGGRADTYHDFQRDVTQGKEGFLIILVDSEGPVGANATPWSHLRTQDGWKKPRNVHKDQAHLMVQCMESWFLADRDALSEYYKQGFLVKSLPGRPNIEEIAKRDVEQRLERATRHTHQKGPYHKTRHGFELLANIDPAKVRAASGHARRLFEVLEQRAKM
jgi:hypothetical protein